MRISFCSCAALPLYATEDINAAVLVMVLLSAQVDGQAGGWPEPEA